MGARFPVQVEIGVLRQIDWRGLVGGCLNVELQLVGVCQDIRGCNLQCAWEALQKADVLVSTSRMISVCLCR